MDAQAYLKRIGYHGPTKPSPGLLRKLHRKHMLSIPFENLDIHQHKPIILSNAAFNAKIIKHYRGGFCYELNGSFANLLEKLGFNVTMLSSRVAHTNGGCSAAFDHMTLLVQLDHPWLADVGFGDSFTEPKRLDVSGPQSDHRREYRFTRNGNWIILSRRTRGETSWEPQYKFNLKPRKLKDFAPRCRWQQTSPRSHFTQGPMCSRLTPHGRVTLTSSKLVVTRDTRKVERPVKNQAEFRILLGQHFGIRLG
jgi:N-hydroxyarylamine O-acetyltransferase